MDTKICSCCKAEKPISEFYRSYTRRTGFQAYCKACAKPAKKADVQRLKRQVFAEYGGKCECPHCDVDDIAFLTIDHINGDGARSKRNGEGSGTSLWLYLKRMGYPKERHRLLCFNCNCARRFGPCPHVTKHMAATAESAQLSLIS